MILSILLLLALEWGQNLEMALTKAKEEQKFVILNFSGSDWCAPCIQLKKEVFESPAFSEFAEKNLLLVRADFPRLKKNKLSPEQSTYNDALAEKYNPEGKFPLTLLLSPEGKIIQTWEGYPKSLKAETLIQAAKK
jgi:thioredoxin-related protein